MRYLLTFIFLFVCSIVEASPAPDWVFGKGHPSYDSDQYLIGVGHSEKSIVLATESARAELSKSISVRVNTVTKDYNSTKKSFSEASTSSETDFLLEGSQVKDGWYDEEKEVYYSLVVLKREYAARTLKALIDVLVAKNSLRLRQGDTFFNHGNVLKALVYYYDGYIESAELLPYIRTYKSVILNANKVIERDDLNLLFGERLFAVVDNLRLELLPPKLENDEFTFRVKPLLYKNRVNEFPIKFYSVYKDYVDRQLCSYKGCSTQVSVLDIMNKKYGIYFRAVIDIQRLQKYFNYKLNKKIVNKLKLINVAYKQTLNINEVPDDTSMTQLEPLSPAQQERNRKQRIFNQMDATVQRGLNNGRINFRINFGW